MVTFFAEMAAGDFDMLTLLALLLILASMLFFSVSSKRPSLLFLEADVVGLFFLEKTLVTSNTILLVVGLFF